jgi:hypothetical protein
MSATGKDPLKSTIPRSPSLSLSGNVIMSCLAKSKIGLMGLQSTKNSPNKIISLHSAEH